MKVRKSFIIGIIVTILLLVGVVVAFYLSQQRQDVRQRASESNTSTTPFGQAVVFSQLEQSIITTEKLDLSHDFTTEIWLKPDTTQGSSSFPIIQTVTDQASAECNDDGFSISGTVNQGSTYTIEAQLLPFTAEGKTLTSANHPLQLNAWSSIALTVDSAGVAKLFVNGDVVDTQTLGRAFCSRPVLLIGKTLGNDGGSITYKGQFDELRVSDTIRYLESYSPSLTPFVSDATTLGLWHFDNNLTNEFNNINAQADETVSYTSSTIAATTPPVCQGTVSTCSWNAEDTAAAYHYIIRENGKTTPIGEGDVTAPVTSTNFVSEANKTYTCEVTAINACGTGAKGSGTATCVVPTPTPTPTGVPPSPTPTPTRTPTPTPTLAPSVTPSPTPTGVPPTPTPTPTTVPPTPTPTGVPPTATPVPPTATVVVPTNTPLPTVVATDTPIPGVPTNTPTPTIPSPGSAIETITIVGGILLTIVGALLLFAL